MRFSILPIFAATLLTLSLSLMALPKAWADEVGMNAAADCPTVELDQPGQAMEHVPVFDQKTAPVCAVYAASTLATAWMQTNWATLDESFARYGVDPKAYAKLIHKSGYEREIFDADLGRICQAFQFITHTERNENSQIAAHAIFPECKMWGLSPSSTGDLQTLATPEAFESKIHEALTVSDHPMPIGIEYCFEVTKNPFSDYIVNRSFRNSLNYLNASKPSHENFAKNCGFHASVIIGQAMRNQQCEFKIRNSMGFKEKGYDSVGGDMWVPAKALSRNVLRLIEIKAGS